MNIEIIRPNQDLKNPDLSGIFLAGPIQGAIDWQNNVIDKIKEKANEFIEHDFFIASPRSLSAKHHENFVFNNQVDWETKYLLKAAETGVIFFYLCNETAHYCNRSYAQTTRAELFEWITRTKLNNKYDIHICFDSNFSGTRYIQRRLSPENNILSGLGTRNIPTSFNLDDGISSLINNFRCKING